MRQERPTGITRKSTGRTAGWTRGMRQVEGGRWVNKWGAGTSAALLAVLLIFGDALLTVEVHRVSLDADRLRKRLERLELELGSLDSQWAFRSSRVELEERASQLGLIVPSPDQVVLLPQTFIEDLGAEKSPGPAGLRMALVDKWMRLNPMGIP